MPRKRILHDRGVVRVTFELPPEVKGQTIHLVGDFTSWKGVPMERRKDGSWQTSVDLEPGRSFEFRYMIDGTRWENDWAADRYVRNPFGHENSVVETPALGAGDGSAPAAVPPSPAKSTRKAAMTKAAAKTSPAKSAATKKAATKKSAAKKAAPKSAPARKTDPKKTPTDPARGGESGGV